MGASNILKGSRIAEIDTRCISDGVDSRWLMKNAGNSVSRLIIKDFERVSGGIRGVIVCGSGNNGGDGFVAAADLIDAGFDIDVFHIKPPEKFSADSSFYFKKLKDLTKSRINLLDFEKQEQVQEFEKILRRSDFVVDAIFGTGLHGSEIHGQANDIIGSINNARSRRKKLAVYSVDIPSGIDSDNAAVLGTAIKADRTVTFGCKKLGLALYPGKEYAGETTVADIGIDRKYFEDYEKIFEADLEYVASKIPEKLPWTYKHAVGKLLVIAGSVGFSGAAAMTCQAALRSGAGIVTLVCPWEMNSIFETMLTEVMTYPVEQTDNVTIHMDAYSEIAQLSEKFDAIAMGPGLSQNPSTICLVREVLKNIKKPTILDADGLRALYGPMDVDESKSRLDLSHVVITPHSGELASILGRGSIDLGDRLESNYEVVKKHELVSVLKGASTIITDTKNTSFINPTGSWALATAGTGDILAGIIGSLLAQGMDLVDAAVCGAFIHGLASDIISKETGKTAMIATDLLEGIKEVFKEIEKIKY
jgi:NAD(P)H-hydrate epimerase